MPSYPGGGEPKVKAIGTRLGDFKRQVEAFRQLDLWRVVAVFFLVCFLLSVLSFLMLQQTYDQVKDIVFHQQTEIIAEQSRIIRQQDQALRDLIGDDAATPLEKVYPIY